MSRAHHIPFIRLPAGMVRIAVTLMPGSNPQPCDTVMIQTTHFGTDECCCLRGPSPSPGGCGGSSTVEPDRPLPSAPPTAAVVVSDCQGPLAIAVYLLGARGTCDEREAEEDPAAIRARSTGLVCVWMLTPGEPPPSKCETRSRRFREWYPPCVASAVRLMYARSSSFLFHRSPALRRRLSAQ
jgi:hypothetical protein